MLRDRRQQPAPGLALTRACGLVDGDLEVGHLTVDPVARQHIKAAHQDGGLEHGGWATIVTGRGAIEARVMVTDRIKPLRIQGREMHLVGTPYHWGSRGLVTGDSANELTSLALDNNTHINEYKVGTCDIQPGRRPRGEERLAFVEEYRRRAGVKK